MGAKPSKSQRAGCSSADCQSAEVAIDRVKFDQAVSERSFITETDFHSLGILAESWNRPFEAELMLDEATIEMLAEKFGSYPKIGSWNGGQILRGPIPVGGGGIIAEMIEGLSNTDPIRITWARIKPLSRAPEIVWNGGEIAQQTPWSNGEQKAEELSNLCDSFRSHLRTMKLETAENTERETRSERNQCRKPRSEGERFRNQRISFSCERRRKEPPDAWSKIAEQYGEKFPNDRKASAETLRLSHDRNCSRCRPTTDS